MPPPCCRKRLAILGLALSPARYFPWQQALGPSTTDGYLFRPSPPRFTPALLSFTIYSFTLFYPQPPPSLPLLLFARA
jgi:hypothetical protein